MKKGLLIALLVLAGLLLFAACANNTEQPQSPQEPSTPTTTPTPTPTPTPAPLPPIIGGGDDFEAPEGPVIGPKGTGVPIIIYSNSFTDERLEWLQNRAGQDGFVIEGVAAGGGAIADRLIAEKHNPIADVVFGLNIFLWDNMIRNDVILQYVPAWASEIPPGLSHVDGWYHALVIQAILLMYDVDQVSNPPTDWPDLWNNPEYHGKYEFETALTGGTTRMVVAGILGRYLDPSGYLGVSDEGWKQIEQYYTYGFPNYDTVDIAIRMVDPGSEVTMGQIWHAGIPMREAEHGFTAGWPVPSVGVPFVVEGIAPVKGTKNLEEAQLFIEWFGTAQIQSEWQLRFDSLPANVFAQDNLNEFQYTIASLPVQNVDWDIVAQYIDQWAEHIMLTYMP